ncbi:efflux RND transporter periplasmic adaptor subunit [Pedobacter jejuensis]|uniref:Efflux RND transporter periplasmic adaptor subunit n=1 Tax=Pedobacter jejuensis TaxID=1268550 RepID=A0A3N0BQ22_9SPHI|nr:efflux RND transporter periplasmic adaptor subunit [Pedobacter jejuensis]RNL51147.1 efflux RND transporter periplasmic adaptor subunit [Pedobacter jejuensis]
MKRNVIFLGLCALLYVTGCKPKKEEKEEVVTYAVTSPLKIDTSFTKEYVSQIKSVRNIEIRALEKGYLQNIYVDEGQHVRAGQVLFRIMPKMLQAELLKAQAETKSAEIELENTKLLTDKNVVSKNELAMAKAKLQAANAETSLAKMHLGFTEIRAPFDGTIDRIPFKLGSMVDEGALLTSLSDNSQVFAYFNVSEPEYLNYQSAAKVKGQQEVGLLLANNELLKSKGKVEVIESEFNNETGNIAFRARFTNTDNLLRNGETGKIQMVVPLKNALVIPQKATYDIQDKTYVFVLDGKNKVHSRVITIASELPDLYVIGDGLALGDKILLEGVQKVKDDDKITYKFQQPQEVIKQLRLKTE